MDGGATMRERIVRTLVVLSVLFVFQTGVADETICNESKEESRRKNKDINLNIEKALPPEKRAETDHVLKVGELDLHYHATAGTLPIKIEAGAECRIFFISYELQRDASRPLTFVFNGGPGASSAYLHLAALGPRRVIFNKDGGMPGPPSRLAKNIHTWLRFTDLVFVDPIGTGYSRCVSAQGDGKKEKGEAETGVWGVQEDLTSLAKFIRLYLTRSSRWLSPKFLVGESYGGFRVAALSDLLTSDYGVSPNGIILVSPALEFGHLMRDEYRLLPWVVTLPSYAATAAYHKKAEKTSGIRDLRASLQEIEDFAVRALLPALAETHISEINATIAGYIGLPESLVERLNGRISPMLFAKELLRGDSRLISMYDGSWTVIDPVPASPFPPKDDPLLVSINTLLTAGLNSYMREHLKFETDIPYMVLNKDISKKWNWKSGLISGQGFAGVTENLKNSMSTNKALKVFIAHGVFDLVTPYFGSVILTKQMSLNSAVASNLSLKVYEGGHMFYTHMEGRIEFFEDARHFFKSAFSADLKK